MFKTILSVYDEVKSCVIINELSTEFVSIKCGVKQGCILSSMLFNVYINDLACKINSLGLGVDIGFDKIAALLYADVLVLISESENDLLLMLNKLQKMAYIQQYDCQ